MNAIITGASQGIGKAIAEKLAENGCHLALCSRSIEKLAALKMELSQAYPNINIYVESVDVSNKAAVIKFASNALKEFKNIDLLINNAGVMNPPFSLTKQGFESQFSVNYLGHFMLTKLLLNSLGKVEKSKIVNVSSLAAEKATIDFDSFRNDKNYDKAYGQSKLALLLFTFKLNEYLKDQKHSSLVFSAHP